MATFNPIDYASMIPQQDFVGSLGRGFQLGAGVRQVMDQRAQQQRALELQQQYFADANEFLRNPTAQGAAALALKYPSQREAINGSWKALDEGERRDLGGAMTQALAALYQDRPDIAVGVIERRIEARKNAGLPTAGEENVLNIVKASPRQAQGALSLILSSTMDPEKFAATFGQLGQEARAAEQAPADLARKTADAQTAQVKAKFAEQSALLDLEKTGWDIRKIQMDAELQRDANRIAAMNAATAREGNDLKRQEMQLKVQEARGKLDDKIREKVSAAESGAANIDNMLNTIARIENHPGLPDVVGSIEGSGLYPNTLAGVANTFNPLGGSSADARSDAIALIDTLGSQAFLAQIPNIKGMGALSNAEGEKLQAALQNLSRKQSEKQFKTNLNEASRLLKKSRENLSRSTGVPLTAPDTPAAPSARPPLSSFNQSSGGASGSF